MAQPYPLSPAIQAARASRLAVAERGTARFQWFMENVSSKLNMTLRQRIQLATNYLLSKVVKNISVPVVRGRGPRSDRNVVIERSVAGEFPRVETARLMRDIFGDVREVLPGQFEGYVGTTLDYGLILETKMNRSFLVRSLNEERDVISRMLTESVA